ncbi:MAG: acyl dehydratase [Solirubrobacteraceae bacterium]
MTGPGRSFDEVSVGEELPAFTVVLTLQRLVMEAGANRDFSPWHFDPEISRASGADHAFANTTLVETLLEACIRSWAGLAPRIRVLEFAMRKPSCAGEQLSAAGVVTATRGGNNPTVEIEVWIESATGRTVQGTAVLAF